MKPTRTLTDDELIERALKVLLNALGPVETTRFINLKRAKRLESVKRHRQWQTNLNEKKFLDDVFGQK